MTNVYDAALKLYNKLLGICLDEYEKFPDAKIKNMDFKYNPINLTHDLSDYTKWFKEEELDDSTLKMMKKKN